MSAEVREVQEVGAKGWRGRLAVPSVALLAILCCLGAPFILGAAASLTAGAWFGVGVGLIALLALCLFAFMRLGSERDC